MRVLLIKLSSMGDVIHTLPAINDAYQNIPDLKISWLIEPGFAEIANWHPAVEKVITLPLRKKQYAQIFTNLKELRKEKFDLILDAQGLLKSAVLARIARGNKRVGFDWPSAREHVASVFYDQNYSASWQLHAVTRLRNLFAQVFGYKIPQDIVDYGVKLQANENITTCDAPYLMFLHGTTWDSKHWPEAYWIALANLVAQHGYHVHVTWATTEQQQRAQRIAAKAANVIVLPHLTINQAATVLARSKGVVAVDTGFAHLSAALAKPTVALFGATDVRKCATLGQKTINLASKFKCSPCARRTCNLPTMNDLYPPCYAELSPQIVWDNLVTIL